MTTLGILASGRGSNCEALLRAVESGYLPARIGIVISDNPDAPVLELAAKYNVKSVYLDPRRKGARLSPDAERTYIAALQEAGVEWIALAGFMRILGNTLLEAFPQRVVNIHPSLLPAFPGLEAQRQALEYGVRVTGATVHFVDAGVDTGPIVLQKAVPVHDRDTVETLKARILEQEHTLYIEAFRRLLAGEFRFENRRVHFEEEAETP